MAGHRSIGLKLGLGLVFAAALQTAALGWMILGHWMDLRGGTEVVLQSTMVDPRDFFRGNYVALRLNIQQIAKDKFAPLDQLEIGKPLFVTLKKGEDAYWVVATVTTAKPDAGPFLKSQTVFSNYMLGENNKNKTIRINLPFTRYFAPKKRAQELEKLRNARKMGIIVSVLADGRGKIKGVSLDGVLVYDESLF